MPYVERNQAGDVTGWARRPTSHATEFLAEDHPDMASFRGRPNVPTDSQLLADIVGDVLDDVLGQARGRNRCQRGHSHPENDGSAGQARQDQGRHSATSGG